MTQTVDEPQVIIGTGDRDPEMDGMVLTELDRETEWDLRQARKCDGIKDHFDCPNEATLLCETKCCQGRLLLCEDCFFAFYNMAKRDKGDLVECRLCHGKVVLTPNHLTVVRRIRK